MKEEIGHWRYRNRNMKVFRDHHGKYYVKVGNRITQKRLTANEIVRYLINAMHEGIGLDNQN